VLSEPCPPPALSLVMLGNGPFALPTFEALYGTPHRVRALLVRPAHGRRPGPPSPLRAAAERQGTPVHEPEDVNAEDARALLAGFAADLLVVCDYGQILKSATLATARLGGINLHASLLPRYRGAAPINWALYHGESETGVTVIHMDPRIDAGPCLAQERVAILPDETAVELEARLARLGAPLVCRTIDALAGGAATPLPQDPALATRAPRLKKSDGEIDWNRSAAAIANLVRAMQPWPRSSTAWLRPAGEPLRLIVDRVRVSESATAAALPAASPGTVLLAAGGRLLIQTGNGELEIGQLQPAGKRAMTTDEFLRGYPLRAGERLGPANG